MGEHRAVIGTGMAAFAAARRLKAVDATNVTSCFCWSPTRAAKGLSIGTAEAPVSVHYSGAFGPRLKALFDSSDGQAGPVLGPEAVQ